MIDTHAHIDDEAYSQDFSEFIDRQRSAGVNRILVPATNAAACRSVYQLCSTLDGYALPAFGLHPEDVREDWQEQISQIKSYYQHIIDTTGNSRPIVAVGEIGLDYHFSVEYKKEQLLALRSQLDWALELSLPVMIHSRDSTDDCLSLLEQYAKRGLQGVMHCFSGSRETAQRVINMGFYFGIGGVITFKNSRLADTLTHSERFDKVPLERLVLETDCPYMAPVPYRGQTNEPRYIDYVIERLAQAYQVSRQTIEQQTDSNAKRLFHLND